MSSSALPSVQPRVRGERRPVRQRLLPWLAAAIGWIGTGCSPSSEPPSIEDLPNVLLVTVDTLRADHLGCYGYPLDTSPTIDELARRGVRFEDCTVQWPKTWPSMASLMTGAHPRSTGMRRLLRVMPDELPVLAGVFGDAGYRTAAVVANYHVGRTLGFDKGFDHFVESWQERWEAQNEGRPYENAPGLVKLYTNARLVNEQASRFLGEVSSSGGQRPFFLWVHYMDPHGPYLTPPGYESLFRDAHPPQEVPLDVLPRYQHLANAQTGEVSTDLGAYVARYDGLVRFLDDELGQLLDDVERAGAGRELVIALSADHGESLGEHDYYLEHGRLPYQPCAHVPLIVVAPERLPAGRVVEEPVGLLDFSRTLVELVGLQVPDTFEGASLLDLLHDRPGARAPKYVFMESGETEPSQLSVRHGRWKLVRARSPVDRALMTGATHELYDLEEDPGERFDIAEAYPEVVEQLDAALERWLSSEPLLASPGAEIDMQSLDPRAIEMLRSLGYVGDDEH